MDFVLSPQLIPALAFTFLILSVLYSIFFVKKNAILFFISINAIFTALITGIIFFGFALFQTYRILTIADYIFLIIGILIIVSVVILIIFRSKIIIPAHILILTSALTYTLLFCEIAVNICVKNGFFKSFISISDGSFGAFNKPCAHADLIRGYRWENDSIRIVKSVNSTVVYDRVFLPNNKGYVSDKNYSFKKRPDTFRFLVLGDSYTASEYLQTPWTDQIERIINEKDSIFSFEFYSFALDGIGLSNWHSIFFNEMAPNYEFDALILAIYGDDLYRDFYMMFADDTNVYGSYFKSRPENIEDFEKNYKKNMYSVGKIMNDNTINKNLKLNNFSTEDNIIKNNLYLLIKTHSILQSIEYNLNRKRYLEGFYKQSNKDKNNLSIDLVKSKLGVANFKMLEEIFGYCNENKKTVIIANVPHIEIVKQNNYKNCKSTYQLESEVISDYYHALYFDSYPLFQKLPYDSLQSFYLKHDAHWNQKGSDFFSQNFAQFINEHFRDKILRGKKTD